MSRPIVRADRQRCFRFALWVIQRGTVPTPQEISGFLGISVGQARRYRHDWLAVNTPNNTHSEKHA